MPEKNSLLQNPDPMVMNKEICERIVCEFLKKKDFEFQTVDNRNDADIRALKLGWQLLIETRGNQAKSHAEDMVFDSTQISIHFAEQIQVLLKFWE